MSIISIKTTGVLGVLGFLALAFPTAILAADCNNNGIEDAIDIADGTSLDCQPDGVPDECQSDCNVNNVPDDCDVLAGATDLNGNNVPDECEVPPTVGDDVCWEVNTNLGVPCGTDADCSIGVCGLKSRYITIAPPPGISVSIQVTIIDMPLDPSRVGEVWWAKPEGLISNSPHPALPGALLECVTTPHSQVWTDGFLHFFGTAIVPGAKYEIRTCQPDGLNCSPPVVVGTGKWGDVLSPFDDGQPSFTDISAIVEKFSTNATAPDMTRTDFRGTGSPGLPNVPDSVVDKTDISAVVDAFTGRSYPFTVVACPFAE